jgi:predicted nucleotidyltransferase
VSWSHGRLKRGRSSIVSIATTKQISESTYSTARAAALASAVSGSTALGAGSVSHDVDVDVEVDVDVDVDRVWQTLTTKVLICGQA